MPNKKLKIIFMGTPEFSVPTLSELYKNPHIEILAVVTMPDRPAGRGNKVQPPPVAVFANEKKINLFQTENLNKDQKFLDFCQSQEIDFFYVLAFAQFLGSKVLSYPKLGCFNVHTSLLPKYRGAAPIQYALLNGDASTGVSIQRMVKEMDAGNIVHELGCDISPDDRADSLSEKLQNLCAEATKQFVANVIESHVTDRKQYGEISFAPTIKKTDGFLDFKNTKVKDIINRFRAFYPWPGVYFFINNKRIKIHEISISQTKIEPGLICTDFNTLEIGCLDGSILISKLQLEGKKVSSDVDFLNGHQNKELILKEK